VADSLETRDGGGFDLLAASLRSSGSDVDVFVEVLADKLEQALPGKVVVERRALRRFAKEKRVARIEVALGDNRYSVVVRPGVVEARCAKAVRGVVLKTEELSLDSWLAALGRELAVEAEASEQSRVALDQLLRG
jgi:hypothetical protein